MRSRSAIVGIVFVVPFVFIVFTAAKDQAESARLQFTLPTDWLIVENLVEVDRAPQRPHGHARCGTA